MKVFLIPAAAIILAACAKEPATLAEATATAQCTVVSTDSSQNIFNSSSAKCSDGGYVYFFPTAEANQQHGKVCAGFGGKAQQSGKTWTKYLPSC